MNMFSMPFKILSYLLIKDNITFIFQHIYSSYQEKEKPKMVSNTFFHTALPMQSQDYKIEAFSLHAICENKQENK